MDLDDAIPVCHNVYWEPLTAIVSRSSRTSAGLSGSPMGDVAAVLIED
jgi:hypothetical protein